MSIEPGIPSMRAARATDVEPVHALLRQSRLPVEGIPDSLHGFVVAEDGAVLIGVAGIEPCGVAGEHALLRSVTVAAERRGSGLGRTLVERVIGDADAAGIRALYLLTTTAEHYFPAFGFHSVSRGSVPDDVRVTKEFAGACPASATVMVRTNPSRVPHPG